MVTQFANKNRLYTVTHRIHYHLIGKIPNTYAKSIPKEPRKLGFIYIYLAVHSAGSVYQLSSVKTAVDMDIGEGERLDYNAL